MQALMDIRGRSAVGRADEKTRARLRFVAACLVLASMLFFAGEACAVTKVRLSIKNAVDSNGEISVPAGKTVKVKYKVLEDPLGLLGRKDQIQLVRVKDNSVITSIERGEKESGVVSLKVKKSKGEQLYVRYLMDKGKLLVSRVSYPADPGFVPLLSAAKRKPTAATGQAESQQRTAEQAPNAGASTAEESQDEQLMAKLKPDAKSDQRQQKKRNRAGASKTGIQSFDIRGVSLGMNLSTVEQVLRASYPDFDVVPINYKGYGQTWTGILAALPRGKHKHEVILVDFNQPPLEDRAIAITRYKEYPADATPSLQNLEAGLLKKYGPWSSADATTRAGYRKIYSWRPGERACIGDKLYASYGRLRQIVDEGTVGRVLGDAYGDPSQYITAFRQHVEPGPETPACDKQIAIEVSYRPDQNPSPVNKLITVIADFPAYYDSELAYSKMATAYEKRKSAEAVERGGEPDL